MPASTRISVDLPEPFGPIRPMRSPSETGNATSRKSGADPKAFVRPCAFKIGGISSSLLVYAQCDVAHVTAGILQRDLTICAGNKRRELFSPLDQHQSVRPLHLVD